MYIRNSILFLFTTFLTVDANFPLRKDFDPDIVCSRISNGTKIKDPHSCHSYFECVDQHPISRTCGNLFFDRNSGECVSPSNKSCLSSDPCAANPNGFTSDPYSCNGYYYCSNGVGVRGECSPGMNYNPESENCMRDFPCEISLYPEDECNVVPDGTFIKVSKSCRHYQLCWRGDIINGTCPNGFFFDALAGTCDYPQYVDCKEESVPEPQVPENIKCSKGDIFISDGSTCNGYFYCEPNGDEGDLKCVHGICPPNRFFTCHQGGACVIRTEVVCPYDRCATLGEEHIQLANVSNDGCRGYSICQNGREIARAKCPDDLEYFDEVKQMCTKEVVRYTACVANSLV